MNVFRLESYITPIIWSYFSKYVKNFRPHDFQVSLWNGGAVFSNLELNLEVLDSELQIPLTFASGHIQELKITVPWRKIMSEPIVLNVNSMELVLHHREMDGDLMRKKVETLQSKSVVPAKDQNSGYVHSAIARIVTNVRVNFENVVIKYIESDIAFSINVGEASMTVADENWKTVFLDRIVYSPDFVLRKKLSFSDVNICLDRCNNAGLVDKFQDPMLYRCDFDVRIVQKFATSFSRIPYFYRMDLFLGHLQFCVTDEQIPMLVRLYNLFSWLMESGTIDTKVNEQNPSDENQSVAATNQATTTVTIEDNKQDGALSDDNIAKVSADGVSWSSWATGWLFYIPEVVFGEPEEQEETEEGKEGDDTLNSSDSAGSDLGLVGIHSDSLVCVTPIPEEQGEELNLPPATTHFGVYIKTLTVIFKAVKRRCDRPVMERKIISIFPFLKCSIQGVVCDFIVRGNENSHTMGVSSIMVDGLGYCPCGVQDCSSREVALPAQGGECYFEAGKINSEFSALSFFQSSDEAPLEWCYDVDQKAFFHYEEESKMLERTPAFFLRYIVIRNEPLITEHSRDNLQAQPEVTEIIYHGVAAPCKLLVCSGLIHRLKMIYGAINNYGYEPYGAQLPSNNASKFELEYDGMKPPVTTYRLVVRQPLIEIFAADHPSDYCAEKRADFFRRSGGILPPIVLPRLTPEWPRMVISWDILELTAEDSNGHFRRLRSYTYGMSAAEAAQKQASRCESILDANQWASRQLEGKAAFAKLSIAEVLFTFIAEPMELNVGIKAGALELTFANKDSYAKTLHNVDGSVILDSVTCSTRLEKRSNVLWLPFSFRILSALYFQPNLIQPTVECTVESSSLNLFIGPETVITMSQLVEKLQTYLEEFLPPISDAQAHSQSSSTSQQSIPKYTDDFSIKSAAHVEDFHKIGNRIVDAGVCMTTRSLFWRFPNARTVYRIVISKLPVPLPNDIQLELEYLEEYTNQFYHFSSFKVSEGMVTKQLYADLEHNIITANVWRIRILNEDVQVQDDILLKYLSKSLVVESIHVPKILVRIQLSEVLLNLVNNTFYSGKHVSLSALQPYGNTEGVCPADHILAALNIKESCIYYSAIEGLAKCNVDFCANVKVLEYESVVLEPLIDTVVGGLELMLPSGTGPYSLKFATNGINLKIGASVIHSVMYSAALWSQIISSFDAQNFKMASNETKPKIILHRVLVSNDLNTKVQIRSSDPEALGAEKIPSKDCKAISFPSLSNSTSGEKNLFLSFGTGSEIKISAHKTGYTPYTLDNSTVFVNVSNLSSSQKLVKISGSVLLVNGLDRAVEVCLALHTSVEIPKFLLPSRGVGPTLLYNFASIEHLRFRFITGDSVQPWGGVVDTNIVAADPVQEDFSVQTKLLTISNNVLQEINVWVTKISEETKGSKRHLIVLSPVYCLRSWLCSDTLVHVSPGLEDQNVELYSVVGKGRELEIRDATRSGESYFLRFQSSIKVPPSGKAVEMQRIVAPPLPSTSASKSIDNLISKVTNTSSYVVDQDATSRWPFIDDDIPLGEWNTEINPETEIMVSYAPWIEGLPTTVAEIRPWALFINLSGVDILFAQETKSEAEWDQYWVPYKCTFSPKRMEIPGSKFRIGLMMNDFLVKSPPLQFSDEPERLSVKKINKDSKVPIDCYSRLDLFGGSQVACLTIETRVRNKILIFVVRPTYSIQNRTSVEMFAAGVTTSSVTPQRRESWTDDRLAMYSSLAPCFADLSTGSEKSAVPILHFTTDGHDYSAESASYKYLALSCGGPWWFIQLVDCSEDHGERGEGIPGSVVAVNVPKIDCTILNPLNRHKLKSIKTVNESIVAGLYNKSGQVWVSLSENNAPQFTIHNKSNLPLFYVEKSQSDNVPRLPTPCFQQFLMVPPNTSGHFNSLSSYNIFPQLRKREDTFPDLLLAEVSQDLVDFVTSHQTHNILKMDGRQAYSGMKQGVAPSGNLLFPDFAIDWQRVLNVSNNPTQYAKFGQRSVKISVEIVGYTHHVLIENTKVKEVSATAIRRGFTTPRNAEPPSKELFNVSPFQPIVPERKGGSSVKVSRRLDASVIGLDQDGDDGPPSPAAELAEMRISSRPWKIKAYIPELYVSVQDNMGSSGNSENEFLGLTFEPIIIEQVPLVEDSRLRPIECPKRESWVYAIRVGNIQVDTPNIEGQRSCEFLVAMEAIKKNERGVGDEDKCSFAVSKFMSSIQQPSILNFDATITMSRVTADEVNLETIWLKILPFSLYIEDRLLSYVIPSVQSILNVFNESYVTYEKTLGVPARIVAKRRHPTAESGVTTHISILDSSLPYDGSSSYSYGVSEPDIGLFGVTPRKKSSGVQSQNVLSRGISFAPIAPSSSSGLNSSNSSIISSSLSHLRLASVSPPPPSPMMHLEPHGSTGKVLSKLLIPEVVDPSEENVNDGQDEETKDLFQVHQIIIPAELLKLFDQLSRPVRLKKIDIQATELELTLRTEKVLYVSLDRSVVQLRPFVAFSSITTDFHLGLELTMHYTVGTIFTLGNPVRVLGSLELLGSPGTLARTVGTGLRDLVVYPYEGILNGPVGFVSGLGYGVTSLLKSVTSGTLNSLTNWAQSVSRNIDRLTLDQQEQLISEAARQVELEGLSDGIVQGLSGFGIRILGAIGGLSHHPIHNVIQRGPSATSVIGGMSRGVFGVVVKPIGGVAELISMTGQGVLLATGWKPRPKAKKAKKKNRD